MNYEDFIKPQEEAPVTDHEEDVETTESSLELDVQKAVVESLAADKAEQNIEIAKLRREKNELVSKVNDLNTMIEELRRQLLNVGDILSRNSEVSKASQVTLLERNPEIDDRFEGETRDHVLEVIKEARNASEADGRLRRAQLLESVLVSNEPSGILEKRRQALIKLFNENQNVINGLVINELDKRGISYKNGEKYLLVGEIIKRTY